MTEVYIGSLVDPFDWPLEAYFDLPFADAYFEGDHVRHHPMFRPTSGLHPLSLICKFEFDEFAGWTLKLVEKQERNSDSKVPDE